MVSKAISIPDTYARVVTTTDDNNTNCCQNWKALLCSEEASPALRATEPF